ncbi:MAG: hypothetical protein ACI85I_002175, partial [Arenicella sp.]
YEGKPVKEADISIQTGLSVHEVSDSFEEMMGEYVCNIRVDTSGELIYHFDFSQKLSDEKEIPFSEKLKSIAISTLKFGFKAWITFMVLFYFLGYVPFIIYALPYVAWTFLLAFFPVVVFMFFYVVLATYTKWFDGVDSKRKQLVRLLFGDRRYFYGQHKIRLNFLKTIFEYVFGKEKVQKDERFMAKNILAYLTSHEYRITTAELSALTGLSLSKSENEAAKLLYQYNGDVRVTKKGVIVYEFPTLEKQIHQNEERESQFIWENQLPKTLWNDNFVFENSLISLIGAFIMIASGVLLFTGEELEFDFVPHIFMAHWLPFIFTLLFFCISFFGKLRHIIQQNKVRKLREIYFFWSQIFQSPEKLIYDFESSIAKKAIHQLDGIPQADEFGNEIVVFERLAEEVEEVEKSRYRKINFKKVSEESVEDEKEVHINEHVNYEKSNDGKELAFYFKRKGEPISYLSLSLFGGLLFLSIVFMTNVLLLAEFATWLEIALPVGLVLFFLRKFIRELSFSVNGYCLRFTPAGLNVENGPIPLMGINRIVKPEIFKNISYDTHKGTYKKLYLNLGNEKFAKPLLENETDVLCLYEIRKVIHDYVREFWHEDE